jgi:hypothetical protein
MTPEAWSEAMEKKEQLTTSGSLENAVFDSRIDIPAGTELSPALRRLVEEVRMETTAKSSSSTRYDRVHNRHNR